MQRALGIAATAFGATAVLLGAFGAHALRGHVDDNALQMWHTGVDYQLCHALALLAIAGFAPVDDRRFARAGWIMAIGVVIFAASLYALALGAPRWLGAVAPIGGVLLITGWLVAGVAFWCSASSK